MLKWKKTGAILLYCCALALLVESAARGVLVSTRRASFLHPDRVVFFYYPELERIRDQKITAADTSYDVLLLGASVLGSQVKAVRQKLHSAITGQPVRVHDATALAHTSLDSLYKYQYLRDKSFDIVVFCHGINEVRANNIPAEFFRSDYSHYAWYREIAIMANHRELPYIAAPYLFHLSLWKLRQKMAATPPLGRLLPSLMLVPIHHPRPEWARFGSEIKSAEPFGANLAAILALSRERGERILVTTFSWYSPETYSKTAFEARKLDYVENRGMPTEVWGAPKNVVAGIRVHNDVVRKLVAGEKDLLFIDMEKEIPKQGAYFVDICHLSEKGTERFSLLLSDAMVKTFVMK